MEKRARQASGVGRETSIMFLSSFYEFFFFDN
jgi:hypothetical protein